MIPPNWNSTGSTQHTEPWPSWSSLHLSSSSSCQLLLPLFDLSTTIRVLGFIYRLELVYACIYACMHANEVGFHMAIYIYIYLARQPHHTFVVWYMWWEKTQTLTVIYMHEGHFFISFYLFIDWDLDRRFVLDVDWLFYEDDVHRQDQKNEGCVNNRNTK